MKVIWRR